MSSKGRRPRQGSLAWTSNTPRGIIAPAVITKDQVYCTKVASTSTWDDGKWVHATILSILPSKPIENTNSELEITWKFGKTPKTFVRRTNISPDSIEDWQGKNASIIGNTKCRGILGPVSRRGLKLQKRKGIGAGTVRHAGCMGCREPGRTSRRKPFAGRTGGCRRTIRNLKIIKVLSEGLLLRGSVPGKNGNIVAIRLNE